mgnify:CR=1 FL=1
MLDWLKTILGDAYTDELDRKISQEIGKSFVARKDFNDKLSIIKQLEGTVAERDQQLETLKGSTGDIDAMKQQIAELQKQNKDNKDAYEAEVARIRLDSAVEAALTNARAKNNVAAKALLEAFLKDAKLGEDGKVKGLDEAIEGLQKNEATSFLFDLQNQQNKFTGMHPGTPGGSAPPAGKDPKDMSYDELCAYLEQNPSANL